MIKQSPVADVFVGRDESLGQLKAHFNNLMEGRGRIVFVAGEAGIGKTVLVNHFLSTVSLPATSTGTRCGPAIFVLRARCGTLASSNPLGAFTELLQGLPEVKRDRIVERLKDWAREIGPALVERVVLYMGRALSKILENCLKIKDRESGAMPATQSYQFDGCLSS